MTKSIIMLFNFNTLNVRVEFDIQSLANGFQYFKLALVSTALNY